jgi:hypothetical protein
MYPNIRAPTRLAAKTIYTFLCFTLYKQYKLF